MTLMDRVQSTEQGEQLTTNERGELVVLEETIERGLQTFVEVGNALLLIREKRLWRGTAADFTAYCQIRWGWTRRRADQLIDSAKVVSNITTATEQDATNFENHGSQNPVGGLESPVVPQNERQARPLTELPPTEQPAAWREAATQAIGRDRLI